MEMAVAEALVDILAAAAVAMYCEEDSNATGQLSTSDATSTSGLWPVQCSYFIHKLHLELSLRL